MSSTAATYRTAINPQQLKDQHVSKQRIVELAGGGNPSGYEDKHLYECLDCLRVLNDEMKQEQTRQELRKKHARG